MSGYLLDTTVLIDFSKGRHPIVQRVLGLLHAGERVGIASVNLAEYYSGVDVGTDPKMDTFIDQLPCWPVTKAIAMTAAQYRRQFRRMGRTIDTPDALVAAIAKYHAATVLTANVKDFPMDDIRVERLGAERG